MSTTPIIDETDLLVQLVTGVNRDDQPVPLRTQSDQTLRVWSLLIGQSSRGETRVALEDTGEQKEVNYGKTSGGAITAFKTESTGEQDLVLHGKDSSSNIDPLRTNDNFQLFYEPYEHWKQVDPYLMTGSDAIAYNPGSTAAESYLVEMFIYNLTAGSVTATVYVDVAAGGSPGNNEYVMNAESVPRKTRVPLPPLLIGGDDDIRAFAGAVDSITLHFRVRQVART